MSETLPLLPKSVAHVRSRKGPPKKKKDKLATFDGVFLPTSLNVLSILMFLRFGFIIGQMGILGSILLLVMSYIINVLTVLSISAISTNGTVKGGGAYYMISRSLGPEFGGAIGIIFFIGQILNASLNVVGFIEPLLVNFGEIEGVIAPLLPVSYKFQIAYSTILLAVCTGVAMVGLSLVSKTAFLLFIILSLSTLLIPLSALVMSPGYPLAPPYDHLKYTGIAWSTIKQNLWPHFTSNAAGSVQPPGVPETFRNMFGIFFPATAGIFAGASMSGELSNPSRSIPKGTLYGLLTSFVLYLLVILSMGASTPRELLHKDIKIVQSVNISEYIIILGEFSTSLFSVIMGVVGAASLLNAIADDRIIPGLSVFSMAKKLQAQKRRAEIYGIIFTWLLAQAFLFADINQIATFITMAFLMTFLVTNLACFLLKLGSAPNFRPSFKYFSSKTALTGGLTSIIAMYICDGVSATSVIIFLVFLIMVIHYSTPPSTFGDISQLLIYHQVRKYLLRLKLQMSVKYWRPQILLLCDDPLTSWNLIGFCNHLKKGGLYILGHVVIINDEPGDSEKNVSTEFNVDSFKEVQKQKRAWVKLRDLAKIKAFVQIAIGPSLPWGVRNVFLGSGLGGMKPNITVLGFYDFYKHSSQIPLFVKKKHSRLPTDDCRKEKKIALNQWVQIVEDLIIMQATVAVAANFNGLHLPALEGLWFKSKLSKIKAKEKKYIDLYPIQMSSICKLEDGKSILSTNFDTYTLILQLGSILSTVDEWRDNGFTLRIVAFVENHTEKDDERTRLETLLESLRIDAEVIIVCFNDGCLDSYNFLVKGHEVLASTQAAYDHIMLVLENDQWWNNLIEARRTVKEIEAQRQSKKTSSLKAITIADSVAKKLKSLALGPRSPSESQSLGKSLKNNRRYTLSNLHDQGLSLSLNMRSQGDKLFFNYDDPLESSDDSESEKDFTTEEGSESSYSGRGVVPPRSSILQTPPQPHTPAESIRNGRTGGIGAQSQLKSALTDFKSKYLARSGSQSSDQLSTRASKSNLRPNFLAVKIPHSRIRDDDEDDDDDKADPKSDNDDGDESGRPSITFVEEGDNPNESGSGSDSEASNVDDKKDSARQSLSGFHAEPRRESNIRAKGLPGYFLPKFNEDKVRTPSILTNDGIQEHLQSPHFMGNSDFSQSKPDSGPGDDPRLTYTQLQNELKELTFNDLPARGQHLILNELMRKFSRSEETAVIFSTLPAPVIGTHLDDDESADYVTSLSIWLDNLPPVVLLNSQTVTVTTSL